MTADPASGVAEEVISCDQDSVVLGCEIKDTVLAEVCGDGQDDLFGGFDEASDGEIGKEDIVVQLVRSKPAANGEWVVAEVLVGGHSLANRACRRDVGIAVFRIEEGAVVNARHGNNPVVADQDEVAHAWVGVQKCEDVVVQSTLGKEDVVGRGSAVVPGTVERVEARSVVEVDDFALYARMRRQISHLIEKGIRLNDRQAHIRLHTRSVGEDERLDVGGGLDDVKGFSLTASVRCPA